jgi:ribosomal protein S27E
MSISLTCKGCKHTLTVRDDLAGKKVKCPRCSAALTVPGPDEDAPVEVVPEEGTQEAPRKSRTAASRRDEDDEDDRDRDRDQEDDEDRVKVKSKYKSCPQCGEYGAKRVAWTAWGSFYGPAMFTHVRCPECGYCYNGKTGRSNLIAAILFVSVPLLGILGLIAAIVYIFYRQGYFGR